VSIVIAGVDTVEHERVDVHVEIERAAEALHDRHRAEAATWDAAAARARTEPPADRAQEHSDDGATERVVPGDEIPQPGRQGQHPLPDGHGWQDAFDQMRGALGHPPAAATRAQTASLAGEGDEAIEAARRAARPSETACETPARQELAKLALDERRKAVLAARRRHVQKCLEMVAHERVQELGSAQKLRRAACPNSTCQKNMTGRLSWTLPARQVT